MGDRWKKVKIHKKLLIYFILVSLISILITGFCTYSIAKKSIISKTLQQAEEMLEKVVVTMNQLYDSIGKITFNVSYDSLIQDNLYLKVEEISDEQELNKKKEVENRIIRYYDTHLVKDITVYGYNATYYNVPYGDLQYTKEELEEYYQVAQQQDGRIAVINKNEEEGMLLFIREINSLYSLKPIGLLIVRVPSSILGNITRNINFGSNGQVRIVDVDDKVLYEESKEKESYIEIEENSEVIDKLEISSGWRIVGIIPREYITSDLAMIQKVLALIILVAVGACIILANSLLRTITRPIRDIVDVLKKAENGDVSFDIPIRSYDEIGEIALSFNNMIKKLSELIEKSYKDELLKRELEFQSLQAQINPHFLYNTLDTVNWMAYEKGWYDICKMVSAVANLMRASISNKKKFVTIKEEMKYIEDYILIQKMRLQDKLEVNIKIEEGIEQITIPKLTIQPLVENAILHGIEPSKTKGTLNIIGIVKEKKIHIIIQDTGQGIMEETMKCILDKNNEVDKKESIGIGIYAVHKRIQYIFGKEYGLKLSSEQGEGTTAIVTFPIDGVCERK